MAAKVLVVYYSRTGATARIAAHVADALGADLESIKEQQPRTGWAGYLRSALEAVAKGIPTIHAAKDPREYDLVVIGTPVWAGTMASPVRAYLMAHRGELGNAAFFAVMAGRGAEETVREMQTACGVEDAVTCALKQSDTSSASLREKCAAFIRTLQERAPTRLEHESAAA